MKPDYGIELDGNIIGHSKLETGDPPMGVASGRVNFEGVSSPSLLFHESCRNAGIEIRHQSILRSLAYKWQRILFRCWKNREL